ncbi:hypothetical protein ACQEVB_06670 [Pseudonocardia sp. CA-107938]|uniref:WXG100 family type VII secretion target n=1 Tax=Pseudonocardia sp. CA-107938 TaxID=3240021 RepID=UPI003D8ABCCA
MAEMKGIGHYNYENVDLKQKAAWLAAAPGGEGDPLPAKLQLIANTFQRSHARLTANIEALGAAWTGQAADAAQGSLRNASQRTTAARQANDDGHAAVSDYGVSFEEMRRKVHFEDPNAAWQPTPTAGAPVPGDPFSVQTDQFGPAQQNRTADAAANAALRAHEQRTRELVDGFPTLTPGAPPAGTAPQSVPSPGGAPTGAGAGPAPVAPGAGMPAGPVPTGSRPPGAAPIDAGGPGPVTAGPANTGNGARSAVPPPTSTGAPAGPARVTPSPIAPLGPLGPSPTPNGRRSAPLTVPPPSGIPGLTNGSTSNVTNGVIGGRAPAAGPVPDGRQFGSKLPVVAEPAPAPARPGQPVAPTTAAGRAAGSGMPPPMMGMGAGGGGSSTRRTKFWTPTSEAFDVALPPHVDGVIGAEAEDAG